MNSLKFIGFSLSGVIMIYLSAASAQDDAIITTINAPAKKPSVVLPNDTPLLNFDFGDSKAVLKNNGEITFDGWVRHSRLRCATYSVSLRFGKGERGCTNVEWLTEPRYMTSKTQCNSAEMEHQGFVVGAREAAVFGQVTCAQRQLRCTGACN